MKLTNIFLYIFFLCTCSWTLTAQEQDSVSVKKTKVYLEHANTLPIFLIADTFNRVVFVSQGYTIGLGAQMMQIIHKLEQ